MNLDTVRHLTGRPLAESALFAPVSGFGDREQYPGTTMKAAVLLQRIASNHALPDGNKRTALLCAILFSNLNGLDWEPPESDEPEGAETAEVVSVAEITISAVGEGYAQEELDAENEGAGRYPLGPKEFWRARLVGHATFGLDEHPMTDEEFEAEWADSEQNQLS